MAKLLSELPRVAVVLPTAIKTCRELRDGILRYVRLNGPWILQFIEGREGEQQLQDFTSWGCTGLIGNLNDPSFTKKYPTGDFPVVLTNPTHIQRSRTEPLRCQTDLNVVCVVDCTNNLIGEKAAEHFLGQQIFKSFAFVGELNGAVWSGERLAAYRVRLEKDGFPCHVYPTPVFKRKLDGSLERGKLADWLRLLPRPCALFVAFDMRARQVLDACLEARLSVPQEIAILSVDDDPAICETAIPQLSSIRLNPEQAGFKAAAILDKAMRGQLSPQKSPRHVSYGFADIVTRASSETIHSDNPLVERALSFIRLNAGQTFSVSDLADQLSVSSRLLELRFKAILGRTVHDEIMLARLLRMKKLLRETNESIESLATAGGFANSSHFSSCFKKQFGISPSTFRRNG